MPALDMQLSRDGRAGGGLAPLAAIVLARIAVAGGATRAELRRDLHGLLAHRFSPAEWRQSAERTTDALVSSRLVEETRNRLAVTEAGMAAAARFLGRKPGALPSWPVRRDVELVAKALGLEAESAPKLKALGKPDGLRVAIVQRAFGLPLKPRQSPARLRADLAVIALERAFGNKIKSGLGAGSGLSAKAGRLLAGQLAQRPREFPSDGRLVAQLAADAAQAPQSSLDALRAAIIKRWVTELLARTGDAPAPPRPVAAPIPPQPANDAAPASTGSAPVAHPDLNGFASGVLMAASECAEGWPGNRKAFISHVWHVIRSAHPEWGLTEVVFKGMLAEAHRAGRLTLANADLKDKKHLRDFEESAIVYKNTVWHFVRVED